MNGVDPNEYYDSCNERDQEPLCNCQQSLALEKRLEVYREAFEAIKLALYSQEEDVFYRIGWCRGLIKLAEASLARVK